MQQLPVNTATGSNRLTMFSVRSIGSYRIILMLLLLLNMLEVNGQRTGSMAFGGNYTLSNFDQYPVAFSSAQIKPSTDALGFSIESHFASNRHLFGFKFSFNSSLHDDKSDSLKASFGQSSILLGYGLHLKLTEGVYFRPVLYAGILANQVTFTNKNNNSLQAISSGNTNELNLVSGNPILLAELEFIFKLQERRALGIFGGYQNGILETSIKNLSGAKVPNAKFNPTGFTFGIKYYPRFAI